MARFQPEYPDFTLTFHLPLTDSPDVSPRAPEDFPSIFALESPGDFLKTVIITIPSGTSPERLFALVTELDAAFPQTDISIWQEENHVWLEWRDREPRESYEQFCVLLSNPLSH